VFVTVIVPVVLFKDIPVPALNDVTPILVKVCTPFAVPMEMPLPEKVCEDEVEPFREVMKAVLELKKSEAFLFWNVPIQFPVVVET